MAHLGFDENLSFLGGVEALSVLALGIGWGMHRFGAWWKTVS